MAARKVNTYLHILGQRPENKDLFEKINKLTNIQHSLSTIIPPQLTKHCTIGLPNNGKLTIYTQNGCIATRLKQISPSLLQKAQNLEPEVTSIHIATQAHNQDNGTQNHYQKKRQLGQSGKACLTLFAASLQTSALKTAIETLLKNS